MVDKQPSGSSKRVVANALRIFIGQSKNVESSIWQKKESPEKHRRYP